MPSPKKSTADVISLTAATQKRSFSNQDNAHFDQPSYPTTDAYPPPQSLLDVTNPPLKRVKLYSDKVEPRDSRNMVQGMAVGTRGHDLKPSAFEPHRGAKKLVIKNLKERSQDLEKYYDDTWRDLDAAVTAILHGERTKIALEQLHRGVEMTCRRGRAEALFEHLKLQCKTYIDKELLPSIESGAERSNVEVLRTVYLHWTIWHKRTVWLCLVISVEG